MMHAKYCARAKARRTVSVKDPGPWPLRDAALALPWAPPAQSRR